MAERVFSLVKYAWTDDRSALKMSTVKSLALVKFNTKETCVQFYNKISKQTDVLRAVKSGQKYSKKGDGVFDLQSNTEYSDDEASCSLFEANI